jgi:putative transposase
MPNHFHAIITFLDKPISKHTNKLVNLSQIISSFKSITQKYFRENVGESSVIPIDVISGGTETAPTQIYRKLWQKSFYDHIIRNEKDLDRIREYICNNPAKWELDKYFC